MNNIDLVGKVGVVTGGAGGLGLGIAKRLQASGARVALWDRDERTLAAASGDVPDSFSHAVDITDYESVLDAVAATEAALGPIDMLVNSAGVAGPTADVVDYSLEDWHRVIDINLNGTFFVNRAIVPGMIARNYGRIVNIASIAGKEGNPTASGYSASKAGVIALTKSLGKETASLDISVNAITPSVAKTPILDEVAPEFIEFMLSKVPRGRFLEIEELAAMVAWLVSKENSFTTGAVFDLSGGRATY